MKQVESITKES